MKEYCISFMIFGLSCVLFLAIVRLNNKTEENRKTITANLEDTEKKLLDAKNKLLEEKHRLEQQIEVEKKRIEAEEISNQQKRKQPSELQRLYDIPGTGCKVYRAEHPFYTSIHYLVVCGDQVNKFAVVKQ